MTAGMLDHVLQSKMPRLLPRQSSIRREGVHVSPSDNAGHVRKNIMIIASYKQKTTSQIGVRWSFSAILADELLENLRQYDLRQSSLVLESRKREEEVNT